MLEGYGGAFTGQQIDSTIAWVLQQQQSSGGAVVNIPSGLIAAWSGTVDNIPDGWHICDGTQNTPDLRDKFLLGAGKSHSVGETGGSEEVTLTVEQMPRHNHGYWSTSAGVSVSSGSNYTGVRRDEYKINTDPTGNSQSHPNMPPYYTLAYIMKL